MNGLTSQVVKNLSANAGDIRDVGSTSGLGRFPGGSHGNSFQDSCLENPMDRGAWQAMVHRFAKSQTRVEQLSMPTCAFAAPAIQCWPLEMLAPFSSGSAFFLIWVTFL